MATYRQILQFLFVNIYDRIVSLDGGHLPGGYLVVPYVERFQRYSILTMPLSFGMVAMELLAMVRPVTIRNCFYLIGWQSRSVLALPYLSVSCPLIFDHCDG